MSIIITNLVISPQNLRLGNNVAILTYKGASGAKGLANLTLKVVDEPNVCFIDKDGNETNEISFQELISKSMSEFHYPSHNDYIPLIIKVKKCADYSKASVTFLLEAKTDNSSSSNTLDIITYC